MNMTPEDEVRKRVAERLRRPITIDQLNLLRQDALWVAQRVGTPGCEVRQRAELLLAVLEQYGDFRAHEESAKARGEP